MIRRLAVLLVAAVVGGCAATAERGAAGLRLDFISVEADGERLATWMLVSDGWLRMGDARQDGYVLFDRATGTIYSVNLSGRQIVVIPPFNGEVDPPLELRYDEHRTEDADAPLIAGAKPLHVAYEVNGRVCYEAVVVPGMLEAARRAEADYLRALAAEQRAHVGKLPVDQLDACELARHAFAADRHLVAGYPILVWDASGSRRELVGYDTGLELDPALFELPVQFDRIDMGAMR